MCGKQKFFICKHCGNMVGLIDDHHVPMVCCGEKMAELVPNTVEAGAEKHLPVVSLSGNTLSVAVGSAPHPMEEAHSISFVYVETQRGGQRKCLRAGEEPITTFVLAEDKPVAVFAWCNLHGLWKTDL